MNKRVLSMLLAIVLIFSILPTTALAAGGPKRGHHHRPPVAEEPATKQIFVTFVDREGNFVWAAGKTIEVAADATSVNTSLTVDQLPEGYQVAIAGDMAIGGEYGDAIEVVVELIPVEEPATKQIFVTFVDRDGKFVAAAGKTIEVPADAASVNTSLTVDQLPEGYQVAIAGDMVIGGEYGDAIEVVVELIPEEEPATKQIYVKFVDREGNFVWAGEKTIEVAADATSVNTSLTEEMLPEGYVIAIVGDMVIGGEYGDEIEVVVEEAAPATKQIFVKFVDREGNFVWAAGKTIEVPADATYVNTSLTEDQLPKGYVIAIVGDMVIGGEYGDEIEVVVEKVQKCKHTDKVCIDIGKGKHQVACADCDKTFGRAKRHNVDYFDLLDGTHQKYCTECAALIGKPAAHKYNHHGICVDCAAVCKHENTSFNRIGHGQHAEACADCDKEIATAKCADLSKDGLCDDCLSKMPIFQKPNRFPKFWR